MRSAINHRLAPVLAIVVGACLPSLGCDQDIPKAPSKADAGAGEKANSPTPKPGTAAVKPKVAARVVPGGGVAGAPTTHGLQFELRPGAPEDTDAKKVPLASARDLPNAATRALLKRLPAIGSKQDDVKDFAVRGGVKPPPLSGRVVKGTFPPPPLTDSAPSVEDTELKVLRIQPEGDLPTVPRVSVTFNQPMVAVTSHEDLAKQLVPVKIDPEPPGQWRWVGTKTVAFEPTGRAPRATEYTIIVPAGTVSASGQKLSEKKVQRFRTPTVKLTGSSPQGSSVDTTPLMSATFNQRIDPAAMFKLLSLRADGGAEVTLERLDMAAYKSAIAERSGRPVSEIAAPVSPDRADRWVGFRATEPLKTATGYTLTLAAGAPSLEGPRLTKQTQSRTFRTYGPFKVTRHRCGWGKTCRPQQSWVITFSNPLNAKKFDLSKVEVSPKVEGLKANARSKRLTLRGPFKGRTTYTVKLSPSLVDTFGQMLGQTEPMTFEVGPADKSLSANNDAMMILDPAGKPRFQVYVTNYEKLSVRGYRVTPKQWRTYLDYRKNRWRDADPPSPPGKKVFDKLVDTGAKPDEVTEVTLDLAPMLEDGGVGQLLLIVQPRKSETKDKWALRSHTIASWLQATRLSLDHIRDGQNMSVLATSLVDGRRLEGVEVALVSPSGTSQKTTDATGLVQLPLPTSAKGAQYLTVRRGNDLAFMPANESSWSNYTRWHRSSSSESIRWFVFDDRKLYKPAEKVRLKGWVRRLTAGARGDVAALDPRPTSVTYRVVGSRGNELAKGETSVNANGGFHLAFTLPKTPNLGRARVRLTAQGGAVASYSHSFQIQEFRRPEFEVSSSTSKGPHIVGGSATVSLKAAYFSGGPLPNAAVNWSASATAGSFRPPNREGFTFGYWTPWWEARGSSRRNSSATQSFRGTTDSGGAHHLEIGLNGVTPAKPMVLKVNGAVTDVNRQTWSTSSSLLVHPAAFYVGLKTARSFVKLGQPVKVEAIVTDLDGKSIAETKVTLKMVRLEGRYKGFRWVREERDPETCEITTTFDVSECTFTPKKGGRHRIYAQVRDAQGRLNESRLTVWVPGGDREIPKNVSVERLQFIPSQKEYRPGDTAELLIQAPFAPAEGVMTISRGDIVEVRQLSFDTSTRVETISIEAWQIPNLHVHGFVVGAATRAGADGKPDPKLPKRPAVASGSIRLAIPPHLRTLAVTATPKEDELEPGASTTLALSVKDSAGKPVAGAEVAVVVVDESVLALTGYRVPDPLGRFYTGRYSSVQSEHLRTKVRLASLEALIADGDSPDDESEEMSVPAAASPSPVGGLGKMKRGSRSAKKNGKADAKKGASDAGSAIRVRKNFDALALFAPELPTNEAGEATITIKLPDNLTRYRIMAVAVEGERRFGRAENTLTARMPLQARLSAPRFLNFGDTFELPVVVHNQTNAAMDVDVAVRATNAEITQGAGKRIRVAANDRAEVRFDAAAAKPGTARFQVGIQSRGFADASEASLPVWTPATSEAFATYGAIDEGAVRQPVKMPGKVVPQFGGVQVQTSSTQLQSLTDAVAYIYGYPFECSEQLASRVLALAALKDVLTAFDAPGLPSAQKMLASVARDMRRLKGMQNNDGGFGFWRRGPRSWPFNTVHVAHALVRAKVKGFAVPADMFRAAMGYLKNIDRHFPEEYPESIRRVIRSYALYVRAQNGDKAPKQARDILNAVGGPQKAGFDMIGWLYPVLQGDDASAAVITDIRKHLNNRVTEEAGTAHFVTRYSDGAHLIMHSNRRADGLLLEGLIADQPKSDLIVKVVRGLMAHRKKGRWGSTQENVWVLLGLDKYFNTYEKVTPNFIARVWLGDGVAGQHSFRGRSTDKHQVDIPMSWLAKGDPIKDLIIGKKGKGRLYYRIGMNYAPSDLKLDPMDRGFTVTRQYTGIDKPSDVMRQADGTWRVKAGAKVRVRVTMVAPTRRYHVALVDPIPAGLEALNPALRGTESVAKAPRRPSRRRGMRGLSRPYYRGHWGRWYEHDNLRDERAEAFRSLLYGGVYTYDYVARATTPGRFVVPPAKAEEMYAPEVFGRSGTDIVIVQ